MKLIFMALSIGTFLALISGTAQAEYVSTTDSTYNTSNHGQVNTAKNPQIEACPFKLSGGLDSFRKKHADALVDRNGHATRIE